MPYTGRAHRADTDAAGSKQLEHQHLFASAFPLHYFSQNDEEGNYFASTSMPRQCAR